MATLVCSIRSNAVTTRDTAWVLSLRAFSNLLGKGFTDRHPILKWIRLCNFERPHVMPDGRIPAAP